MGAQCQDELFDVVDENDCVIAQATRGEVHAKGLLHRAVHVYVFNAAGQVFLQRRSLKKDTAPGRWSSSAAGHVDSGEDYDTSIFRELGEELGIRERVSPERLFKLDPCEETGNEFVWLYRLPHEGPFMLNPDEISGDGWYAPDEVDAALEKRPDDFAVSFRYIWRLWRSACSKTR